jgi:beta-aspartyl-peptidase (threonine type)
MGKVSGVRIGLLALLAAALALGAIAKPAKATPEWSLVIHGGAGVIERASMGPEQDAAYRASLATALQVGSTILRNGGSALDAVEQTARVLEDDPLFNAGRGATLDATGKATLDAAIMSGEDIRAGAVAGLTTTRNPISAARAVMEKSRHVLLVGEGADAFACEQRLEQVPNSYFVTERRWRALEKALREQNLPIPPRPDGLSDYPIPPLRSDASPDELRFGTIGVVARDKAGHIVAGTSTGGLTAKRWGRVGDAPIIGAGTYANSECGVSGTGTGEYFIRLSLARLICDRARVRGVSLERAVDGVIGGDLTRLGGDGGVIAMNRRGEIAWGMNTAGMYRARATATSAPVIAIYADEDQAAKVR